MARLFILLSLFCCIAAPAWGLTVAFLPGAGGLDSPFNVLAYKGLAQAKTDLGIELRSRQGLEGTWNEDEAQRQLDSLLKQPVDVIVANGLEWASAISQLAASHPEVRFILLDAALPDLPNVSCATFANAEGGYLAGALAGWMTGTNRVAFIGGVDIPSVQAFQQGFEQGVAYTAPETAVMIRYISQGRDFSGFSSPDLGRENAADLYGQDADIIFAVAGESGLGVIQAAQNADRYVIGVDYDQDALAKGHVLASIIKRVDNAVYEEIGRIARDAFQPGIHVYGLLDGGLSISEMQYTRENIPNVVQEKLLELEEKLRHSVIVPAKQQ